MKHFDENIPKDLSKVDLGYFFSSLFVLEISMIFDEIGIDYEPLHTRSSGFDLDVFLKMLQKILKQICQHLYL